MEYIKGLMLIDAMTEFRFKEAGTAYAYNQIVADNPVLYNVTSVTVEFFESIADTCQGTIWLLDGVSLWYIWAAHSA